MSVQFFRRSAALPALASLALSLALSLAPPARGVELFFPLETRRIDLLSTTIDTPGGDVAVEIRPKFDPRGRLITGAESTVDGLPVSVKGKLRPGKEGVSYTISLKSTPEAPESVAVKMKGLLNSGVVTCKYSDSRGKVPATECPVTLDSPLNQQAVLRIEASVDCKGKISGEAIFETGYGNDSDGPGQVKGRINQAKGSVKLSIKNGRQKLSLTAQLSGNVITGTAKVILLPERRSIQLPPLDLSTFDRATGCGGGGNTPPVAAAGPDQRVNIGDTIFLDGSSSQDADGDPLTHSWTLVSAPPGSGAMIADPTFPFTSFVVDVAGVYEVQLVVNDGKVDSAPDTVIIATNSAPVADAGPDQDVPVGSTVQLDGTGSSDPERDPLEYQWFPVSFPSSSVFMLSDPTSPTPTFVPDLPGFYDFSLTVSDGILFSVEDTVTIRVDHPRTPGWGEPVELGAGIQGEGPQVTVDPDGNAIVVWFELPGGQRDQLVVASRYEKGSGWGTPVPLEQNPTLHPSNVRVASDASGNAIAVWYRRSESAGRQDHIWASRYDANGRSWSTAEVIDTVPPDFPIGVSTTVEVAMAPGGVGFAVWIERDPVDHDPRGQNLARVLARRHLPGTGWEGVETVSRGLDRQTFEPRVGVDDAGNALVVWSQVDDLSTALLDAIYANRYIAGSGWETPERIFSAGSGDGAFAPQLAVDPTGRAFAVWNVNEPDPSENHFSVRSGRFHPDTGWEDTTEELDFVQPLHQEHYAIDAAGNTFAVWAPTDPVDFRSRIAASRQDLSSRLWEEVTTLSDPTGLSPRVTADALGNAIVVWEQSNLDGSRIFTSRYTPAAGWSDAGVIDSIDRNPFFDQQPAVAVNRAGVAVAAWIRTGGGVTTVQANRFEP